MEQKENTLEHIENSLILDDRAALQRRSLISGSSARDCKVKTG